jgi:hypothetical protein
LQKQARFGMSDSEQNREKWAMKGLAPRKCQDFSRGSRFCDKIALIVPFFSRFLSFIMDSWQDFFDVAGLSELPHANDMIEELESEQLSPDLQTLPIFHSPDLRPACVASWKAGARWSFFKTVDKLLSEAGLSKDGSPLLKLPTKLSLDDLLKPVQDIHLRDDPALYRAAPRVRDDGSKSWGGKNVFTDERSSVLKYIHMLLRECVKKTKGAR